MKVLENGKAIIVGLEEVNLNDFPNLKVIGCNMTSCEHLPMEEMERRGIKLISLKGHDVFLRTITSTAEHTIGLIISLMRNYKTALNEPYKDREYYRGHTLSGKTLGIIGYGRIGKMVDTVVKALGMEVIVYDRYEGFSHTFFVGDLDGLLANSDIITLHIPLATNEGFFTKEMFQQMKPTSYFINTSRSGVVEKGALLWALDSKIIAGAAVDFTDDKELVHYARDHDNLILTNHIGGCTHEDMARTEEFIINLVKNYLHETKS